MVLKIFNTLTRKKEVFKPIKRKKVGMYVCGPTVYGPSHLGHARTYVAFDVIRRFLKFMGFDVTFIVNITDIHDDMIKEANKLGITIFDLGEKFIKIFFNDMRALNIKDATKNPRVTKYIPEIIEIIKILLDKRFAYKAGGSVYYDISKFKDYGKLSGIKPDKMKVGVRIETDKYKEEPLDFALWKAWKEGEPYWESPWGKGRPGWHIECSVMSKKYLGDQFDIHGGARDLIFPHHENEIAQSEAATGKKPFVKYWYHTGFLNVEGQKMSKSLGNYITVKDLLKKYDVNTLRLFFLTTHFRSPINFTEKALGEAKLNVDKLQNLFNSIQEILKKDLSDKTESKFNKKLEEFKKKFIKVMENDFNAPEALAVFFDFIKFMNKYLEKPSSKKSLKKAMDLFVDITGIFGLKFKKEEKKLSKEIMKLIQKREEARKNKDWKTADAIRAKLKKMGIQLEDTPEGVKWKIKK